MYLENVVIDAVDPRRLGQFWEAALGSTNLTDGADGFETRLAVDGGPELDLCFQPVAAPSSAAPRLHFDLLGGEEQAGVVERLIGLGAQHLDIGQGDVPWVVLADPEGHPFCVMEERAAYRGTGPVAAIPVLGGEPERIAAFWAELSGWQRYDGVAPVSLRHPSGRGVILEFFPAVEPKRDKNRMHLDLRLEPADELDTVVRRAEVLGAARLDHEWGDLPWTSLTDPAGNEMCLLPARGA